MKNITKIALGFILISVMTFTSCKKWIDPDINISPNNPAEVPIELMLSGVQAEMGFTMMGNDAVRTTNMWMQYLNGNSRQSLTQGRYQYKAADVNNIWGSVYASIMMDLVIMIDKAKDEDGTIVAPHYSGVAKVLLAWNLGMTTDLFGDIPYSEAFLGFDNLQPHADTQESIYGVIQVLLTEAIAEFAIEESLTEVGEEDLFYAGELTSWTKLAYSLKAKFELQLSERGGNMQNVIDWALLGIDNNEENLSYTFGESNPSPLYQFHDDRGDVQMGETFIDMLLADTDPRTGDFAADAENGGTVGSPMGTDMSGDDYSNMGVYLAAEDATVYLMTASETQFILAEAYLANSMPVEANAAYLWGGRFSVMQVTGADPDGSAWYTGTLTVGTLDLAQLMYQKWIAGCGTNVAYNDYRRTGYPDFFVQPVEATGNIPLRYPYAQDQIDYNENISFIHLNVPV